MNMPAWISFWLKNTFVNKNIENDENSKKKIYIDRSSSDTKHRPQRLISNENEVKNYLLNNQFVSVKLHETNFIEQVKLFRNAECIVGLHGGGFANLAFCKPGTRVIELRSSNAGVPIENLAKKNNLNYNSVIVEAKQIESFNFPNQQGSIHVPLTNLIELIKN
jgi:capsular polysaccharide biosynthesis protein